MKKMIGINVIITTVIGFVTWCIIHASEFVWKILFVMICILGICISVYLCYRLRLFSRGKQLFEAIQQQNTEEHALEVSALREKIKEAIAAVKVSTLYTLPWFIIIGPSAAGKSTLLRHSGLHFPYSRHKDIDIKGFAGTRNCDWWFADEAIILDTAGRYTTEADDKPEWLAFLDMLKKFRRRAPINGVIVALSLSDILHSTEQEIEDHVQVIRARLDELIDRLGVVFPVHIILTKCDLLDGFQAYMADMGIDGREQVWGFQLNSRRYDEASVVDALQSLYSKLCDMRMHKLTLQPQSAERIEILAFPTVFHEMTKKLKPFLELLLKENPYQEQADFKGVYLTSAYQGQKTNPSFFVKHLFKKIIFQDKFLVRSEYARKMNLSLHTCSAVLSGLMLITAIVLLQSSYGIHKKVYAKVESILDRQLTIGAGFSRQKWQSLMKLHEEYVDIMHLTDHKTLSLLMMNKLERAQEKLRIEWMAQMQALFQQDVAEYLEINLENHALDWINLTVEQQNAVYGSFYDNLKTYLMLTDPKKFMDKAYAQPKLSAIWQYILQNRYGDFSLPHDKINAMVGTYIEVIKTNHQMQYAWRSDQTLIAQAQSILNIDPSADSIYAHFMSDLNDRLGYTSLNELMGGKSYGLFTSEMSMPKAFTKQYINSDVLPAIDASVARALEGDWVLNNQHGSADEQLKKKLSEQLRGQYFLAYADAWFSLIASVKIKPFQSLSDASNKLSLLQQPSGPFSTFMGVIRDNVFVSDHLDVPTKISDKMPSPMRAPELEKPFYALRRLTQPAEKMNVSEAMNQYLHLIGRVHNDLLRITHSSDAAREAEVYARSVLLGSETEISKAVSSLSFLLDSTTNTPEAMSYGERTRQSMEPLLFSVIENAWESILANVAVHLQKGWDAQVVDVYNDTLRYKFPFSKKNVDASLEDVSNFFNPNNGILSRFQETYLSPYLTWTRQGYEPQTWLGKGIQFSAEFIDSLNTAKRISEGLFKSRSGHLELTFYVSPVPTPDIEEVIFDSNGQMYRYRNEPEEWRQFVWPGDSAETGARLYASKNEQSQWAEIYHPGVWGLFHLLNAAKLTGEGGAQYLSQWQVKDDSGKWMNVRFKLKADKQHNIFEPGLLQTLVLPADITGQASLLVAHRAEDGHVSIP